MEVTSQEVLTLVISFQNRLALANLAFNLKRLNWKCITSRLIGLNLGVVMMHDSGIDDWLRLDTRIKSEPVCCCASQPLPVCWCFPTTKEEILHKDLIWDSFNVEYLSAVLISTICDLKANVASYLGYHALMELRLLFWGHYCGYTFITSVCFNYLNSRQTENGVCNAEHFMSTVAIILLTFRKWWDICLLLTGNGNSCWQYNVTSWVSR